MSRALQNELDLAKVAASKVSAERKADAMRIVARHAVEVAAFNKGELPVHHAIFLARSMREALEKLAGGVS